MCGEAGGAVGVEVVHRALVPAGVVRRLGRERVDEVLLDLPGRQVRRGHPAGDAPPVACAVEGDHVGGADQPGRLDRHQLGITRPESDTPESAGHHSSSLAIALTAAAVIALPPRRPRTTRYSRPSPFAASASFDSAAPMKPTGMPRIAAGRGAPSASRSSRWNNVVGALPIATTAP